MPSAPQTDITRLGTTPSANEATAIPPGYKQTEVGVIPQDWESRRIDTVCRLINGRGFKPFEWQNMGLPIIRIQNLNGSDDFNFYTGAYDTKLEVEPGQLLFAWSGSRGTSFGPHIWQGPLGLLNYHTWKVQVHETEIKKEFFLHALRQLTTFIEGKAHGASALVHTQKWEMEGFQFPLPPTKAEQEAIAEALSDADKLLEALEKLIVKKQAIKQAAMQQLLTGKTRLPGFSGAWTKKPLIELATITMGQSPPSMSYNLREEGLPLIQGNADIKDRRTVDRVWTTHASKYCDSDDMLLTVRAPVGAVAVASKNVCLGRGVCGLKPIGNSAFLFHALVHAESRWQILEQGSTFTAANSEQVGQFRLCIPTDENEQRAIATVLSDMDTEIASLEQRRDKTRAIKQGMMQQLLTGRVRLVSAREGNDHAP